jgi:hypothetical protein
VQQPISHGLLGRQLPPIGTHLKQTDSLQLLAQAAKACGAMTWINFGYGEYSLSGVNCPSTEIVSTSTPIGASQKAAAISNEINTL